MITLQPIDETNFLQACGLKITPEQQKFVQSAPMILARAYAYRAQRGRVWGIYEDRRIVGLAMLHDLMEEPACYHLCEFLIDVREQGKGYGRRALGLILGECRREGKFSRVEVCVKKENAQAIHVYEKAGFRDTGYSDLETPDCLCMARELPQSFDGETEIRLTGEADLSNVQRLWADPDVMRFVGFPEGLYETMENLQNRWLPWVQNPPKRQHYSVYVGGVYCGESFYDVDKTGLAAMDIKLLPPARGKGIAFTALSHALAKAFCVGGAVRAYVDPNPENAKALALYASLGFLPEERPKHLEDPGCPYVYLEMSRKNWEARHGN